MFALIIYHFGFKYEIRLLRWHGDLVQIKVSGEFVDLKRVTKIFRQCRPAYPTPLGAKLKAEHLTNTYEASGNCRSADLVEDPERTGAQAPRRSQSNEQLARVAQRPLT